jgi:hypothetical protein
MRARNAVLAALVAVAASGCDGGEDPGRVEGSGYSFDVPDGWRILDDEEVAAAFQPPEGAPPARFDADLAIVDEDETGSNITVAVQEGRPFPRVVNPRTARLVARVYSNPALTEAYLPAGAGFSGEPNVHQASIAGTKALDVEAIATIDEDTVLFRQLLAPHEGTGYVVQLAADESDAEEAGASFDEVLESWTWN